MPNEPLNQRACARIGIWLIGVWWISMALKQFFVVATFPRPTDAIGWSAIGDMCIGGMLLLVARFMKAYEFPD